MRREFILGGVLAAALALYVFSRTQRGALLAADAVEALAVNAERLLPRGLRNKNPGNLRFIARNAWDGQVARDDAGFGVYSSMALGVRAAARQLLQYQRSGLNTVRALVSTWAPSNENDTAAYVKSVAGALRVAADQRIDVAIVLPDLAEAIFRHEVGAVAFATSQELTKANIRQWVRL